MWGRASKRELLRQNDYKCLMSPLSLSSGHTWVGFAKMSIHESFLVVLTFLTLIRNKKIFLNTLGSSSFSFFLLLDTLYTLWVLALFS